MRIFFSCCFHNCRLWYRHSRGKIATLMHTPKRSGTILWKKERERNTKKSSRKKGKAHDDVAEKYSERKASGAKRKGGKNTKEGWLWSVEKFPLHYIDGYYFCFVETDNTRKQPFRSPYEGFFLLCLLFFLLSLRAILTLSFAWSKKIHSIANKGKYKNYFDTEIMA